MKLGDERFRRRQGHVSGEFGLCLLGKDGKRRGLILAEGAGKTRKDRRCDAGAAVFRFNPAGAVYFICEPSKLFMATGRRV